MTDIKTTSQKIAEELMKEVITACANTVIETEKQFDFRTGAASIEVEVEDGRRFELNIKSKKAELSAKPQEANMVVAKKKVAKKAAKKVSKKKAVAKKPAKKAAKKVSKKAAAPSTTELH